MQALEALVTSKVVDAALAEVEVEVVANREGVASEGATPQRANTERALNIVGEEAEAMEVAPKDKAN